MRSRAICTQQQRVKAFSGIVRRRCFITDSERLILPAFGAFAGGLNVRDKAFEGLFAHPPLAGALGVGRVHAVGWRSLVADREGHMINGAHLVIYSKDAEADRAFLKDVLSFPHVDVGHGWLLFRLPETEAAVHPSDQNDKQELFLMCDDLEGTVETLVAKGVACEPFTTQGWGRMTRLTLPGGGGLGLYEPRHARP